MNYTISTRKEALYEMQKLLDDHRDLSGATASASSMYSFRYLGYVLKEPPHPPRDRPFNPRRKHFFVGRGRDWKEAYEDALMRHLEPR